MSVSVAVSDAPPTTCHRDDDTRLLNIVSSLLEQFFEIAGSATDGEAAVDAVIRLRIPTCSSSTWSMPIMTAWKWQNA
jgi:hypothetical protein